MIDFRGIGGTFRGKGLAASLLACTLLLLGGVAGAQDVAGAATSGTISGTLGDAEVVWRTVRLDLPDGGEQNTASYTSMMGMRSFTLQGHQDGTYIENALAITFAVLQELNDCPCTFTAEAMYWTSSSMFEDVYMGNGEVRIDEVEELGDGRLSFSGTFSAPLVFQPSIREPAVEDDVLDLEVSFDIDRVDMVELDL